MYIHTLTHMHAHRYIYMYTYVNAPVYIHTHIYTHTYIYIHIDVNTCLKPCMCSSSRRFIPVGAAELATPWTDPKYILRSLSSIVSMPSKCSKRSFPSGSSAAKTWTSLELNEFKPDLFPAFFVVQEFCDAIRQENSKHVDDDHQEDNGPQDHSGLRLVRQVLP